jgi:hypothetical protein
MKKRLILLSIAALALLTITGINVHLNKIGASKYSDVTLKNIEALSDEGSNNQGYGNTFYYKHLIGKPDPCTLYKYRRADGSVYITSSSAGGSGEVLTETIEGMRGLCPKPGDGCTAISCRQTP